RRGTRGSAAATQRRLGQLLERRQYPRIRSGAPMAGRMEALSRRPDLAGVAGEHEDARSREDTAREFQRLESGLAGKHGLFFIRPQWFGFAVRVRHQDQTSSTSPR